MPKIPDSVLVHAILACRAMDVPAKAALVDEIFLKQPNLLASAIAMKSLGVPLHKIDFLLDILIVIFIAMEKSNYVWPCISILELDLNSGRISAMAQFGEGLSAELKATAALQFTDPHPERMLLAYVLSEVNDWVARNGLAETDNYVILAAVNMVNCVAYAKATKRHTSGAGRSHEPASKKTSTNSGIR